MPDKPKVDITTIDGIHWRTVKVPMAVGPDLEVQGMTVRSLRKILEGADPDSVCVYMAENNDEVRASQLIIGVIGGVALSADDTLVMLVGPEAVGPLKAHCQNINDGSAS